MGRLDKGLLGGYTGKVGTTVGSTWKGINVVRTYQPNVANPRSEKQVSHRNLFKQVTAVGSLLLGSVIKPLWDKNAKRMSGYNAFIQANMLSARKEGELDYNNFILSRGRMGKTFGTIDITESEALLNWTEGETPVFGSEDDLLYAVIFDHNLNVLDFTAGEIKRTTNTWHVTHDGRLHGNATFVAFTFMSPDGKYQADSVSIEVD